MSVCTVILTETQGSGIKSAGKLLTRRLSSANSPPPAGDVCPYKWRERVFCPPHPLYCKMSNTGVCVCARVCVSVCMQSLACLSVAFSFPPNRKQHLTLFHRYKLQTYAHTHTHVHMHARINRHTLLRVWLQIHMSQSCKKTHTVLGLYRFDYLKEIFCEFVL